MSRPENPASILESLTGTGVEFIVVGGTAAVMLGAPVTTLDVDIVHSRTEENIVRLLGWLTNHRAYHRFDLANRRRAPEAAHLSGTGHINLQTDLGFLDVLCELAPGEGYEQLVADTMWMSQGLHRVRVLKLERLIKVKAAAGRAKDRLVLPVLIATLEEQRKREPK